MKNYKRETSTDEGLIQKGGIDSTGLLEEVGVVASIDGGFAYIETQRQTGCRGCSSASGCGTSALATLFNSSNHAPMKVTNKIGAQVGDEVTLVLDETLLIKHSFMAYGVPLLGLFIFAIGFNSIGVQLFSVSGMTGDLLSILGGGLGVILGWMLTHKIYDPVLPEIKEIILVDDSSR